MSPAGSGKAHYRRGFHSRASFRRARGTWWWPTLAWLMTVGIVAVSDLLPPALAYAAVVCACGLLGSVLGARTGDPSGLKDHRQ